MNEFFAHPLTVITLGNAISLGFLYLAFQLGTKSNANHLESILYQGKEAKRDTITTQDQSDNANKLLKARKRAESIYNAR